MHTLSPGLVVVAVTFGPGLLLALALCAGAWLREWRMRRAMSRNVARLMARP